MKNLFFVSFLLFISLNVRAVDIQQIEKDLNGPGVQGWVHGAVPNSGLYVFTYRNPSDFFDYIQMSLVTDRPEIQTQLASFGRHDKVLIKGKFLEIFSPQKHIDVSSVQLISKYVSGYPSDPYSYEGKIPEELQNINDGFFLVHAVVERGHILVVEYKDVIIPIFVQNNTLSENLFRNDIVELKFKLQGYPNRPTHLQIDEEKAEPVKVVDSIKALNGKPAVVEGALIMFPKSPEIKFNVFAVQQELGWGLKRQFTLVNFDDPNVFSQIRKALQDAWDRHPKDFVNGRNKFISKKVSVRATGIFNEVDANQANPQILLKSLGSIQIIEK